MPLSKIEQLKWRLKELNSIYSFLQEEVGDLRKEIINLECEIERHELNTN